MGKSIDNCNAIIMQFSVFPEAQRFILNGEE